MAANTRLTFSKLLISKYLFSHLWLTVPCLILSIYVFAFDFNGFLDMPNHLARGDILRKCFFGKNVEICSSFVIVFNPLPPFISDLTLVLFLAVFPALFAEKVAIYGILILFVTAWYLLYRRVNGSVNAGYVAGLSLVISHYLYNGFYAFLLSVDLALIWVYLWWPVRNEKTLLNQAMLALGLIIIFGCHLAGFVFLVVIYVLYDIYSIIVQKRGSLLRAKDLLKSFFILGVSFVLGMTMLFAGKVVGESIRNEGAHYKSIAGKIATLLYPFINFSLYIDSLVVALVAVILFWALDKSLIRNVVSNFWMITSLSFFLLFALFPTGGARLYDLDCRFLFVSYLGIFLGLGSVAKPKQFFSWGISVVLLAGFATTLFYKSEMNTELKKASKVLRLCDQGKRLIGINSLRSYPLSSTSRVNPFPYFSNYYIFYGGSFVAGIFDTLYFFPMKGLGGPGSNETHFIKFHGISFLDATKLKYIQEAFDYVLVSGLEGEAVMRNNFPKGSFSLVAQEEYFYLFATKR